MPTDLRASRRATVTSLLWIGAWALTASCASTPESGDTEPPGKLWFSPADWKLEFLDESAGIDAFKPLVTDKIASIVDLIEQKLPPLLAAIPPPAPTIIELALKLSKPIIVSQAQQALFKVAEEHPNEILSVTRKYNVFKAKELSYDLLEVGDGDAQPTLTRVNDMLRRTFRTTRSVRLARRLLAVAKKDAEAVKLAPDATTIAGVGVGALCITELSLAAITDSRTLLPELQAMSSEVANQMGANPLQTLALAPASAGLAAAIADLGTVPADGAGLLQDAADLLTLLQ